MSDTFNALLDDLTFLFEESYGLPPVSVATIREPLPFEGLTIRELKTQAKGKVKGYSRMSKAQLQAALCWQQETNEV